MNRWHTCPPTRPQNKRIQMKQLSTAHRAQSTKKVPLMKKDKERGTIGRTIDGVVRVHIVTAYAVNRYISMGTKIM